jgi:crotonobetainyl-CoA:carnitine CoA-transferase CaiB-like acyl-CoA transferase
MNKIEQIKALLGMEVKLATMKLANGTEIEAEVFEAENEVFIVSEEEKVALPVGEYELEDGKILVVVEEGIISEIKEKEEETEEEVEAEVKVEEEEEMQAEVATPKKVVESVSKETHFAKIEEMQKEIDALKLALEPKEEVEEVKEEVELSAEEVAPIKHNPEADAAKKDTFLYSQKAPKTTKSVIYNKLFK